jgi:hypothetical protein
MQDTYSGQNYAPFTTTAGAAKARPGHLVQIVVTSAVTGSITIYDNPSAASGNILYISPAAPTAGQVLPIGMPARSGMWVVPGTAGGFNVVYS